MSLSEAKGEYREAGQRAARVNEPTCCRVLQGEPFKNHAGSVVFINNNAS